mmetsp:Transcript_214/g.267  ORF Transcript_214/g.267 Transcript_214/m.267 type:complete len:571 (+) Transcript_214:84-1796(+)
MFTRCCAPIDIDEFKDEVDAKTKISPLGKTDSAIEDNGKTARENAERDPRTPGRLQRYKLDWTIAPSSMRSLRRNASAVSVDKSIYTIGGYDGKSSLASIEKYDARNKKWKIISEMKLPVSGLTSSIIDNKIYIAGGFRGSIRQASCSTYNVETDVWEILPKMNHKRGGCVSVVLHKELYVIGGHDGLAHLNNVEILKQNGDETGWDILSKPMNEPRSNFSAVIVNDAIYVVGGENENGILASIEKYHAGKWSQLLPMRTPRRYSVLTAFQQYLVVMGGDDGVNCLNTCLSFDTETEEWRELPPMNICRSRACAVTTDDQQRIHVIGGFDGSRCLSSIETCDIFHTIPSPPAVPPQPDFHLSNDQALTSAWIEQTLLAVESYHVSIHTTTKQVHADHSHREKQIKESIAALEKELQDNNSSRDLFLGDLNTLTKTWLNLQKKRVDDAKSYLRSMGSINSTENMVPQTPPPPRNPNFIEKTNSGEIPDQLKCPITLEIMMDPVIAADGMTYERKAIEEVLASKENALSPKTNLPLSSDFLIENVKIRRMCREHIRTHLECREDYETERRFG